MRKPYDELCMISRPENYIDEDEYLDLDETNEEEYE